MRAVQVMGGVSSPWAEGYGKVETVHTRWLAGYMQGDEENATPMAAYHVCFHLHTVLTSTDATSAVSFSRPPYHFVPSHTRKKIGASLKFVVGGKKLSPGERAAVERNFAVGQSISNCILACDASHFLFRPQAIDFSN